MTSNDALPVLLIGGCIGAAVMWVATWQAMRDAWLADDLPFCTDCRRSYARCGQCFYRAPAVAAPHRPGWRYRCRTHRLLALVHAIPQGPDGAM